MKILIADDEEKIRTLIKEYAIHEGYSVLEAKDGEEVISMVTKNKIDLIILDIMMPKLDGISAYKEIKNQNIPTIILSAKGEEEDKLQGFEIGVDDYVSKPFSPKELMARIKAVTKRYNKEYFDFEGLHINFKGHVVTIDGKVLQLTPKEYELLTYFTNNIGVALSREELLNKIWDYNFFGDDRTVDTHIKMLRNNLGKYRDLIETVRGVGYKFETK